MPLKWGNKYTNETKTKKIHKEILEIFLDKSDFIKNLEGEAGYEEQVLFHTPRGLNVDVLIEQEDGSYIWVESETDTDNIFKKTALIGQGIVLEGIKTHQVKGRPKKTIEGVAYYLKPKIIVFLIPHDDGDYDGFWNGQINKQARIKYLEYIKKAIDIEGKIPELEVKIFVINRKEGTIIDFAD